MANPCTRGVAARKSLVFGGTPEKRRQTQDWTFTCIPAADDMPMGRFGRALILVPVTPLFCQGPPAAPEHLRGR